MLDFHSYSLPILLGFSCHSGSSFLSLASGDRQAEEAFALVLILHGSIHCAVQTDGGAAQHKPDELRRQVARLTARYIDTLREPHCLRAMSPRESTLAFIEDLARVSRRAPMGGCLTGNFHRAVSCAYKTLTHCHRADLVMRVCAFALDVTVSVIASRRYQCLAIPRGRVVADRERVDKELGDYSDIHRVGGQQTERFIDQILWNIRSRWKNTSISKDGIRGAPIGMRGRRIRAVAPIRLHRQSGSVGQGQVLRHVGILPRSYSILRCLHSRQRLVALFLRASRR